MKTQFIQTNTNPEITQHCINIIKQAYSNESWLKDFLNEYKKTNSIPNINVQLYNWSAIKNEDINWEYEVIAENDVYYYYENYRGLILNINEDPYTGKSKVYKATGGFPDLLITKLEGLDHDQLYKVLNESVFNKFIGFDDCDLKIKSYLF